ncbi:DNA replication licensing factor MCM8 [Gossypium arboreum]|uniref:DNA replication licensing factor MCM8 n=1 Tax=Gossypium arboreum TaxID=29729 RepID=A0A0B0N6K5_GOSAR|nr:DNA replication licensing factor MCM8 [Gossypium arboreum]
MDRNKVPVRGDIHVIVVGDPGLGKSQLLQAAAAVSPRGIYVCGNATTNAGLTVAVVKDTMTSDYAFEAGS